NLAHELLDLGLISLGGTARSGGPAFARRHREIAKGRHSLAGEPAQAVPQGMKVADGRFAEVLLQRGGQTVEKIRHFFELHWRTLLSSSSAMAPNHARPSVVWIATALRSAVSWWIFGLSGTMHGKTNPSPG